MWSVVENGKFVHMTTQTETETSISKPQEELTKDKNDKVFLNSKDKFILSCALSRE